MPLSTLLLEGGIGAAGILTLLQVSKININPWSWILNKLGQMMTRGVIDEVKEINGGMEERLHAEIGTVRDDLLDVVLETNATQARYRILRFNDELLNNQKHSKEHFEQILEMIDKYEEYCKTHPEYPNTKCESACKHILANYHKRLEKRDFAE